MEGWREGERGGGGSLLNRLTFTPMINSAVVPAYACMHACMHAGEWRYAATSARARERASVRGLAVHAHVHARLMQLRRRRQGL